MSLWNDTLICLLSVLKRIKTDVAALQQAMKIVSGFLKKIIVLYVPKPRPHPLTKGKPGNSSDCADKITKNITGVEPTCRKMNNIYGQHGAFEEA